MKDTATDYQRMLELGEGLAIYKVHCDTLRERSKNARVMDDYAFRTLTNTIKEDKRLESLPFCYLNERNGVKEFGIISGHHRVRAARSAGVTEVYVIVDERNLTEDQIKSKQLAHNALSGHDDAQILKEIYDSIGDLDEKMRTGLVDEKFKELSGSVSIPDIELNLDYQILNVLFLPDDFARREDMLGFLNQDAQELGVADMKDRDRVKTNIMKVFKEDKIKNVSSAMRRMMDIVEEYYNNRKGEKIEKKD